jgi:LysR family transcriptional regulator, glycine cleavage system transcriptional activator
MHALRAFEAAARHLSFSRAAEELHLTHGAVSHALRAMEAELGTALFRRRGNTMLLTDAGQLLAAHVRDALARLARGLEEVRVASETGRPVLTVSVLPAFAARWLLPRLTGFYALHPEIDVVLRATPALADFVRENVDLAIRYGPGQWPGLEAEKLLDEAIFPVCSPGFLGRHALREPADLLGVTLLRDLRQPWQGWFRLVGLVAEEPVHGPAFNDAGLLLQSAAAGHGVALARANLAREDMADGRLVRLFADGARAEYAYYLVRPAGRTPTPKVAAFATWLRDQVAAEGALPAT